MDGDGKDMKALLSVYDKSGLADFGRKAEARGYQLISTGGTHKTLLEEGLNVTQVSELTGSEEILDGRVKTLHPVVHGGILARRDIKSHVDEIDEHGIDTIDLVVVNLYPFIETVSNPSVDMQEALENIDIGGPTMIRAAAKNFPHVIVVVDPSDYQWLSDRFISGSEVTYDERKKLAQKAFQHVSFYDTAISSWLREDSPLKSQELTVGFKKLQDLRYGENPHQDAGIYAETLGSGGIAGSEQLHGLPMSYTNFLDADGAWTTVNGFTENACVIVKHTNPCGISVHPDQAMAYQKAFEGDSVSAYGGIVGFNRNVTASTANAMKGVLFDIIVAPSFDDEALEILKRRKRTRVLRAEKAVGPLSDIGIKTISGGALIQTLDTITEKPDDWKVVTERIPTEREWADLVFSWKCLRYIKSNTIVLAKDNTLVGMGAGQPNRVVSVHLALRIAGAKAVGSALASDAFMPFADNIEMAAEGGVIAVAQPGGSIRDDDVIEAANKANMAMVFTGIRHFNH